MRKQTAETRMPQHKDFYIEHDRALAESAMVLELTAACNAKCPGCFPQYLDLPKGFAETSFVHETISAYAAKGGQVLVFTARGEPLLDKRIPQFVKFAKDCGIGYVEFTSNGQLLTENLARDLIESGLDTIRFSMTGSTQDVYAKWQGYKSPFKLEQTEMNILRLANLRTVMGSVKPRMYLRYIYDGVTDNQDALSYFRKWINQIDELQYTLRLPVIKGGNAVEVLDGAEYSDIPKLFSSGAGKVPCVAIGSFSVTSDGMVTLCSSGMGEEQLSIGNIRQSSFTEVAGNYLKGTADLKATHATGKVEALPDPCQGCFAIVDGGNNCQDFDILLMMTVAHTVELAKRLAKERNQRVIVIGTNAFAKMCLLHAGFRDLVDRIVDSTYAASENPFEPEGHFKGFPVSLAASQNEYASSIVILADDSLRDDLPDDVLDGIMDFWSLLGEVNGRTFHLPDLRGIYNAPGNVWHLQMQENVCFWAIRQYLVGTGGALAISTGDYHMADRLLQVTEIHRRVLAAFAVFEMRGKIKHPICGGMEVQPLSALSELSGLGTVLVANQAEYDEVSRYRASLGSAGAFEIVNYQVVARRARLWLGYEALKSVK
jgi:radical SAM protein with 4Fe4S-binding SPASM domain